MKFIPLTKKEPPFNERLIIWVGKDWIEAELVEQTLTANGKVFKFVHKRQDEDIYFTNATHYMLIEGPKDKE